jgi:hypothetical protein
MLNNMAAMNPRIGLKTSTDQELLVMSLEILDIEINYYYINDDDDDDNNTCPLFCALLFYAFLL